MSHAALPPLCPRRGDHGTNIDILRVSRNVDMGRSASRAGSPPATEQFGCHTVHASVPYEGVTCRFRGRVRCWHFFPHRVENRRSSRKVHASAPPPARRTGPTAQRHPRRHRLNGSRQTIEACGHIDGMVDLFVLHRGKGNENAEDSGVIARDGGNAGGRGRMQHLPGASARIRKSATGPPSRPTRAATESDA